MLSVVAGYLAGEDEEEGEREGASNDSDKLETIKIKSILNMN